MNIIQVAADIAWEEDRQHKVGDPFFAKLCPAGKLTIGYGRNIDPAGGKGLSEAEARFNLRNDVLEARSDCEGLIGPLWEDIDEVRQGALAGMRFQLGPVKFRRFRKMLAAIPDAVLTGDWAKVADEAWDSVWSGQRPGRPGAATPERAARVTQEIRSGVRVPRT